MNIQEFKESLISKVQRLIEYLRSEPFDDIEMKLGDGPRGLDERLTDQKKYHYKNDDPFSLENELLVFIDEIGFDQLNNEAVSEL